MTWTAIVVSAHGGEFSHSFTFDGPLFPREAYEHAVSLLPKPRYHASGWFYNIAAVIKGEHLIYHPSTE